MTDNTPTPALDLDALEALCDGATPGPWYLDERYIDGHAVIGADDFEVCDPSQGPHTHISHDGSEHWGSAEGRLYIERDNEKENATFIAAARSAVPQLIAQLRQAQAERDAGSEATE